MSNNIFTFETLPTYLVWNVELMKKMFNDISVGKYCVKIFSMIDIDILKDLMDLSDAQNKHKKLESMFSCPINKIST